MSERASDAADRTAAQHVSSPPAAFGSRCRSARGAIGATAMQLFTKHGESLGRARVRAGRMPRVSRRHWRDRRARHVAHDSYLINLASPDPTLRQRVTGLFRRGAAAQRSAGHSTTSCRTPAITWMTARAGSRGTPTRSRWRWTLVPGSRAVLMETTAGAGTGLGATFEELSALVDRGRHVPSARRMGVCADTCHVFAAGYDLVNDFDGVWAHFGDVDRIRPPAPHAPQRLEVRPGHSTATATS